MGVIPVAACSISATAKVWAHRVHVSSDVYTAEISGEDISVAAVPNKICSQRAAPIVLYESK